MTTAERLLSDSFTAARLWRIWTFLGVQDVQLRFRRSILGPLWILLNLGLFVGSAGFVYGVLLDQKPSEFLPYLITGYVIWAYILSSFTEGSAAFVSAEGYIKQFSYPKEIYLLRSLVSTTIVLLFGFLTVLGMQIVLGRFDLLDWLLAIPGLILLITISLGHITISAYLGTRFRDWPHAVSGLLQVVFFVTPIMFPAEMLRSRGVAFIYEINPLYYAIDVVRHPIIGEGLAPLSHYICALIYALLVWVLAALVMRRLDSRVVFLL